MASPPNYELPPDHPPVGLADHCPLGFEAAPAEPALEPIEGKDEVFTLGTRMSKLAMVQTNLVKDQLERQWPRTEIRIYGQYSLSLSALLHRYDSRRIRTEFADP